VLWAASALGQVDIALAFGATICIAETLDQDTAVSLGATVLGVVPSTLELLEPRAMPLLRCVFTWGEAMSRVLAARWRQAKIEVLELLISTEYWLSFISDGQTSANGQAIYNVVEGADVAVLPSGEEKPSHEMDKVGELCLRGPMVARGYFEKDDTASAFVKSSDGGRDYFRTRDLVRLLGAARPGESRRLEFCGRSDQLVKVAGQFVDLAAAERHLRTALSSSSCSSAAAGPDVEAAILPSPPTSIGLPPGAGAGAPPAAHAFVVLGSADLGSREVAGALAQARRALPRGTALHLVRGPLPRDAVTGKVDRRRLLSGIEGLAPDLPAGPALLRKYKKFPQWLLVMLLAGVLDVPHLFRILAATSAPTLPGVTHLLQAVLHVGSVPYLWLLSMYFGKGAQKRVQSYMPFGRLGFICLLHQAARRSTQRGGRGKLLTAAPVVARASLVVGTVVGMVLAHSRGRLVQWWLTFWLAAPDCVERECAWWLKMQGWFWLADQVAKAVQDAPAMCLALVDWTIQDLPAAVVHSVRQLQALWEHPGDLAGVLCENEDMLLPQEDMLLPQEELPLVEKPSRPVPHAAASSFSSEELKVKLTDLSTTTFRPEWEVIWNECMPDACESVDHVGSEDDVTAARAELDTEPLMLLQPELAVATASPFLASEPVSTNLLPGLEAPPTVTESILPSTAAEVTSAWNCKQCACALPFGSDWKSEDFGKSFVCKSCSKELDNAWWYGEARNIIDLNQYEDGCLLVEPTCEDNADRGLPATASSAVGAKLLSLLGRHFSGVKLFGGTSLAGIDSLAVLSLCRALRAQSSSSGQVALRPHEVFQCSTVGELLEEVESKARKNAEQDAPDSRTDKNVAQSGSSSSSSSGYAVWFAPGQYSSTCKWLYGCRGLLDPSCFRAAAARLIARHEGLHMELCDGSSLGVELCSFLRDSMALQVTVWPAALAAAGRIRAPRLRQACVALVQALRGAFSWSLQGSWPRVAPLRITDEFLDERVKVIHCRNFRDVDRATQDLRDSFTPPFIIALFVLEDSWNNRGDDRAVAEPHEWGSPSSFIHFIVSHAYSDGYTSIPLIQDFSALYARAASIKHRKGLPAQHTDLVPLPPGVTFPVLEERFFAALDGHSKWSHPDQMSFRPTCFDSALPSWKPPWVYMHECLLESGGVAGLRRCAQQYGMPFDVALLSLVLAAMFRASAAHSWTKNNKRHSPPKVLPLHLTLYAPMRDGDLNDAMVGLFSDWRDITVPCSGHATVLGFSLDLAEVIRNRRWTVFDPIANSERILVNILPLDEQARGSQQFQQTRAHEYRGRRHQSGSEIRERRANRGHHRPMRITLEQESVDAWWLVFDINSDCYPPGWCRRFVSEMQRSLEDLSRRPLEPVLPVSLRGA